MDFTLTLYNTLIKTLQQQGFSFQTFSNLLEEPGNKTIVLRHDVDKMPQNSLEFARIQAENGIRGTYYYRRVPGSWDEKIIREIAGMGHEVGYHYEDLSFAWAKLKAVGGRQKAEGHRDEETEGRRDLGMKGENLEKELTNIAIESFSKNLQKLRELVPVKTICMHGSPMSRWDSRLLWKYFDYKDFGIVGEPYFDIDFEEMLYLTDTGRRWDGGSVSVRDKVIGGGRKAEGEEYADWKVKPVKYREETKRRRGEETKGQEGVRISSGLSVLQSPGPLVFSFHSTFDIIKAAEEGKLPDKIMITFHPQRWTDRPVPWVKELVFQNVKNVGKYFLMKMRKD
jgi:hypothetical protein